MKVFIFCGPLAFGKGGMEKVAANLANYLAKKNIVTLGYFIREGDIAPAYEVDDSVLFAPWFKNSKGSRSIYSKRIVEAAPDVFIFFGASSQSLEVISLIDKFEIPILMHEGSNPERVIVDNWARTREIHRSQAVWEREALYSQASLVRFTMKEYLNSLPNDLREYAIAFPNAFELPVECSDVYKNKQIINIGGLKPNKNILPLLHACVLIFKKHPDWQLHIYSATNKTKAGQAYVKKISDFIRNKELCDNVFTHSEVDDIDSEYLKSSIHVITSLSEGLSNAVAESMTFGLPTIGVAGVPGVDGLVANHVNGVLVKRDKLKENLAEALETLISEPLLRKKLGSKAQKDSVMFRPANVYENWENAIELCINNKGVRNSELHLHYKRVIADIYEAALPETEKDIIENDQKLSAYAAQVNTECSFASKEKKINENRWLTCMI